MEENEEIGSTILDMDEKMLKQLHDAGYVVVAYKIGNSKYNAKMKLSELDRLKTIDFDTPTVYNNTVTVKNNTCSKISLSSERTLNVIIDVGEYCPNICLEIDNSSNSNAVSVSLTKDGEALRHSAAAGSSIAPGKYVQLTVVGSCWTIAEFEE